MLILIFLPFWISLHVFQAETRFYNISYKDLIANPIEVVKGTYTRYGLEFTPEAERRMRAWLAYNPQHKHGLHRYSMEKYGLTEKDIRSAMGPYLEYFKGKSDDLL